MLREGAGGGGFIGNLFPFYHNSATLALDDIYMFALFLGAISLVVILLVDKSHVAIYLVVISLVALSMDVIYLVVISLVAISLVDLSLVSIFL